MQAANITGIPYRTVDHWARTGLISPSVAEATGKGTERRYSFQDLVALRVARDFRKAGVSVRSLERVVKFLREKKSLRNPLSEVRLAVAGKDVLVIDSCEQLMSALDKPGQVFVFMVNVTQTRAELKKKVQELRAA